MKVLRFSRFLVFAVMVLFLASCEKEMPNQTSNDPEVQNLLQNASFASGSQHWVLQDADSNTTHAHFSFISDGASGAALLTHIQVPTGSIDESWKANFRQLFQQSDFEDGLYRFSFKARVASDDAMRIRIVVQGNSTAHEILGESQVIEILPGENLVEYGPYFIELDAQEVQGGRVRFQVDSAADRGNFISTGWEFGLNR